jgi:2-polyprenyl-3-methyl-5-hydroxy-6-metoxy-1,4-benzoquinol methylase
MKDEINLFGKALADVYHNRAKGPFYVCDEMGEHPLDLRFYFQHKPEEYETELLKHVSGRILDIGCGPGRIMKFLQEQGLDVLGFDMDSAVVQLCKERGIKNVFVESYDNMEHFGVFDTILLLNRTICTAGTPEAVKSLLQKCHACCSHNGILIFDSLEVKPELVRDTPRILQNTLRFKYDGRFEKPFLRLYCSSDIAEGLLKETGWFKEKIVRKEDIYCMMCGKS